MVATGVYRAVEPDEWEQLPYSVRYPQLRCADVSLACTALRCRVPVCATPDPVLVPLATLDPSPCRTLCRASSTPFGQAMPATLRRYSRSARWMARQVCLQTPRIAPASRILWKCTAERVRAHAQLPQQAGRRAERCCAVVEMSPSPVSSMDVFCAHHAATVFYAHRTVLEVTAHHAGLAVILAAVGGAFHGSR